ncbi:hypothetical protein N7533_001933 [Penicillium manginii]|uniref:uncharacterized protein n=1 Tax=Penicillium manginii TaxID=203109 RepID=UPI0025484DCB|nr:uncharacterized protein N7533_001933 [Penicillium manginii]KAJ5763252.1 hypothetical protein N7533_001933 [Penicillium manginii]
MDFSRIPIPTFLMSDGYLGPSRQGFRDIVVCSLIRSFVGRSSSSVSVDGSFKNQNPLALAYGGI